MRKPLAVIGVVGVAGLVALSSSAFTGTGITNSAGPSQFVGGSVSQSIDGATLSSIVYNFGASAPANTAVHAVALTFADALTDGKTPTVTLAGTAIVFNCDAIAVTTHLSTCTTAGADAINISGITVNVA
jgi:hypothetical protein